jgi:ATP-binding cassette subfamily B protein
VRTFSLVQNGISLISFAALLAAFSPWAALMLALAGLPSFIAETKFSGDAFRLFRWRSPETRMQMYLEGAITRDEYAKEVKLYQLGPLFLDRYREIFNNLYGEDRKLTLRRDVLGLRARHGQHRWPSTAPMHGSPCPRCAARSRSAR